MSSGGSAATGRGQHYVKVSYPSTLVGGGMDAYTEKNKPYLDFFKDVVAAYPTGGGHLQFFVNDHDNQAAIIRGMGVPTPPPTNRGHFHIGNDEFWFILEGKIDYLIEGVGLITAQPGRFGAGAAGPLPPRELRAGSDGHSARLQSQPHHAAQLRAGRERHAVEAAS